MLLYTNADYYVCYWFVSYIPVYSYVAIISTIKVDGLLILVHKVNYLFGNEILA